MHRGYLFTYDAEIKRNIPAEKQVMNTFAKHSHKKMKTAGSSECEKMKDLCANWIGKQLSTHTDCER